MSNWISEMWTILGTGAVAASILATIGFFLRDLLFRFLSEKLAHKNNHAISKLEDRLTRERSELNDLRQIVIKSANARNEKLLEKQILASENLWRSTISNKQQVMASKFLQSINIEEMNKHVESGSVSEFVDVTVKISGVQKLLEEAGQKAPNDSSVGESASISRPFVSPLAWALYSAHSSIIWHAVMTMVGWKNGVSTKLLKNDELVDAIKKVLPHQNEFLEKFGVGGTYFLLDEVEEALLQELKRFLQIGETDLDTVTRARQILSASTKAKLVTTPNSIE